MRGGIRTANKQHLDLIKQGGKVWNRWRETTLDEKPDLSGASLKKADLRNVNLSDTDLSGVHFMEANLSWTNFRGADLRKANLRRAHLREANLIEANVSWADFTEAYLQRAILRKADLSWASLQEAHLREADLSGAKLCWADLREADLREANLYEANLREAYLSNANFREANLGEADLRDADLRGTRFFKANLKQTNISGCHIYGVSTWNVNINDATDQTNLIITDWDEPIVAVDNLEVAQFINLYLHNVHISAIIHRISANIVLILGSFSLDRKPILDAMRDELRKHQYVPVFVDLRRPYIQKCIEMISALARMARFILADFTDTDIALHIVPGIVRTVAIPFQPIFLKNVMEEPPIIANLRHHYPCVLETYRYTDVQEVHDTLEQQVILPAEANVKAAL